VRYYAPFLIAYAVIAALIVPGSLLAQDEVPAPPQPAAETQATTPEGEVVETTPAEAPLQAPAPAPVQPTPAPAQPAQPVAPAPAPEPVAEPATDDEEPSGDSEPKGKKRARASASASVSISDFKFAPARVTVNVGDSVTWSNGDDVVHTATANDGSFDTGLLDDGESGSHTFDQAGTFSYFCQPHPFMKGTVTVQAAATGGGEAGGGAGGGEADTGTGGGGSAAGADETSGPTLPATGLDSGGLAVLGLATLALGAWLRRRSYAAN
jgi:LPXTG-motif cell wall-anchored protein